MGNAIKAADALRRLSGELDIMMGLSRVSASDWRQGCEVPPRGGF
jgi:hypothetical protein